MSRNFSKTFLRWFIPLFVFSVIGYASIRHFSRSGVVSSPAKVQKKVERPLVPSEKRKQVENKNKITADHKDQGKDTTWLESASNALTDPNLTARIQAVLSLRKHPSPEAIKLLGRFLSDKDTAVISEAIDTLGFLGLRGDEGNLVYGILKDKAMDKDFGLRSQALVTAAMIGKNSLLPVIKEFISEESESSKDCAVRALSLISSPECVPYLETVLDQAKNPRIRRNSFDLLAKIDSSEALEVLKGYLVSSNTEDQAASARALSRLNRPEFNEMIEDQMQEDQLGNDAVQALATSPAASSIFGHLLEREDVDREQKISYLKTLARYSSSYGPSERLTELKEAIEPLLDDPDPMIQRQAISTIAAIRGNGTAETLMPKLESEDAGVRKQTVLSLVGYVTPDNYKVLLPLLWDNDPDTRRTALMCVEQFVDESDRDTLERAKEVPDKLISKHVSLLLDRIEGPAWKKNKDKN